MIATATPIDRADRHAAATDALPVVAARSFSDATPYVARLRRQFDRQMDAMQREIDALRAGDADRLEDLRRLRAESRRVADELRLAGRVQREMLPKTLPAVGRARFAALYRPAGHVSGDLYDVQRLDERHVGVYLADAIGHGVAAALLTIFLKTAAVTKEVAPQPDGRPYRLLGPGEVLGRLNDALVARNFEAAAFATALYAVVDTRTMHVRYATAGHPAPLLLAADGRDGGDLNGDGAMLGVLGGEAYAERSVDLSPGDRLLLVTDGAEVAYADRSAASLSAESLVRYQGELERRRSLPTAALLAAFAADAEAARAGRDAMDDLTVLAIESAAE